MTKSYFRSLNSRMSSSSLLSCYEPKKVKASQSQLQKFVSFLYGVSRWFPIIHSLKKSYCYTRGRQAQLWSSTGGRPSRAKVEVWDRNSIMLLSSRRVSTISMSYFSTNSSTVTKNVSKSLILFGLQKMCVTLLFESLNSYPLVNSEKFEVSEGIGVSGQFETGSKDHLQWPLVLAKKQLSWNFLPSLSRPRQ